MDCRFQQSYSQAVRYISHVLDNKIAVRPLIDSIEKAIESRSSNPEGNEPVHTCKVRQHRYYRIFSKQFALFYSVLDGVMELCRFFWSRSDYSKLL
ncbi:MAG TPA: type II toxin-antitoxin system RelE/ParE family toxin [Sphaerochaeta sp.]|nr:type II toxin-antitoxin system RelE/ParE family toxin [Sphaerochaeta sp.]